MLEHTVAAHAGEARVGLVGHQPSMGRLLSLLVGRDGLALSKGAVVRLAWERGAPARLVWVVTPKRLDPVPTLDAM
jgi:phosphohistidine phosphatase SixA